MTDVFDLFFVGGDSKLVPRDKLNVMIILFPHNDPDVHVFIVLHQMKAHKYNNYPQTIISRQIMLRFQI